MITGKDYVFTQSDAIEQMLTMKVTFKEAARGGERRIRVRLRDEERGSIFSLFLVFETISIGKCTLQ